MNNIKFLKNYNKNKFKYYISQNIGFAYHDALKLDTKTQLTL